MFSRAIWYWQASGWVDLRHSLCFHEERTKCLFWFQGLIGLEIFQATGSFKIEVFSPETSPYFFFLFFWRTKSNLGSNYSYLHKTFLILHCGHKALFHLKNELLEGNIFSPPEVLNLLESSVKLTWEKVIQGEIRFLKLILIHWLFSTVGMVSHGFLSVSVGC